MSLRDFSLLFVVFLVPETFSVSDGQEIIASISQFPYQASLELRGEHICGGAIISRRFVLTAAHCVYSTKNREKISKHRLRVRVGSNHTEFRGKVHSVSDIIVHHMYDKFAENEQYNIALIRLWYSLYFTDTVRPVQLAHSTPKHREMAWISGYGRQEVMQSTNSNLEEMESRSHRSLMAVRLPIVTLKKCKMIMEGVMNDMICAGCERGRSHPCIGDSGGPIIVQGKLVGIEAGEKGCRSGKLGFYTNVAKYYDWIYTMTDHLYEGKRNETDSSSTQV